MLLTSTLSLLKKYVKGWGKKHWCKYHWLGTTRGSSNWGRKHHFSSFYFHYFMDWIALCRQMSQKYLAMSVVKKQYITSQKYKSYSRTCCKVINRFCYNSYISALMWFSSHLPNVQLSLRQSSDLQEEIGPFVAVGSVCLGEEVSSGSSYIFMLNQNMDLLFYRHGQGRSKCKLHVQAKT